MHTHTHTHTYAHTHTVVKAVSSINSAVDAGDPQVTLEALKAPAAKVRSITDECVETYHEELSHAKQEKLDAGMSTDLEGWLLSDVCYMYIYMLVLCPILNRHM